MMIYVENNEHQNFDSVKIKTLMYTNTPVPSNFHNKIRNCIILSMEEGVIIVIYIYIYNSCFRLYLAFVLFSFKGYMCTLYPLV